MEQVSTRWRIAGSRWRGGPWRYHLDRWDVLTMQRMRDRGLVITVTQRVGDETRLLVRLARVADAA